jgi:uncharacterized membrane protein
MASAPTPTPAASSGLTSNVAAALSYIWIVGLIFLFIEQFKNDKFVRFHAFQSVFFGVACFALGILENILARILGGISLGLAAAFGLLALLVGLAVFLVWIFLIYQAYSNKQFKLPVIGDLAAKQAGV